MDDKPMSIGLTPKQARFCEEYLVDLNATQAAIRAGYSKRSARIQGHENLKKPHIEAAITAAQAARSERTQITADQVVRELGMLAFSNMLDYMTVDDDGYGVVDLSKLTRDQAAAISEVVVDQYTEGKGKEARKVKRMRFKLTDKRAPLVDLGRHLGLFPKANGAGAAAQPPVVNIYNITREQVEANIDDVFKDAAAAQAKKRALN